MNVANLPEDSDSSDEDYVPNEKIDDLPSEIDEDDSISESEELSTKSQKRKKNRKKKKVWSNDEKELDNQPKSVVESVETKTKVDDLWADFVKDTGFKSKTNSKSNQPEASKPKEESISKINSTQKFSQESKPSHKVKITQIFEFAGEEVKVEKEVSVDSAEARLLNKIPEKQDSSIKTKRSAGLSGIGNVLDQLNKKPKISTLEKTKLDWDTYKKEHNIEEELQTFNKGKDGYLEKQDFLQRTDVRQFQLERDVREVERSKRFNSTL